MRAALEALTKIDRERQLLTHIGALLGWDQETYMPEQAVYERAEQLALVESMAHEKAISPRIGELLDVLESTDENPGGNSGLGQEERAYLHALRRNYDRVTKLPVELVAETAREISLSQATWMEAKKNDDFAFFAPHLQKMIDLNLRKAAFIKPDASPYDVLLDFYEPECSEQSIRTIFTALRTELVSILDAIQSRPQVDDSFLHRAIPLERQRSISEWLMDILSFDRSRGRLDTAVHPFTTTLGTEDVRITTKFVENFLPASVFCTIHETGHALYELGIDPAPGFSRTVLSEASSMAIHESQSRLWENMIGRSEGFWKEHFAKLRELAAPALDDVGPEAFFRAINKVEPSFIRTEADEVSYGLHVILRFELEADMMAGKLRAEDIPAAWNAKMVELLGIEPPDDRTGCLQDVHWSMGSFGYFPSYALGNLYSAQFCDTMRREMPYLVAMTGKEGAYDLGPVLGWLRANIHKPGATYLPGELVERVTGRHLEPSHFVAYLRDKYSRIYGF
jgi:carboxypeptidase Taq